MHAFGLRGAETMSVMGRVNRPEAMARADGVLVDGRKISSPSRLGIKLLAERQLSRTARFAAQAARAKPGLYGARP